MDTDAIVDQRDLLGFSSIPGMSGGRIGLNLPFGGSFGVQDEIEMDDEAGALDKGNNGPKGELVRKFDGSDYFKNPLLRVKTVMPFVLFPDELVIDKDKVTFVERTFFASEVVRSVLIKDILDVEVSCSLLFATLTIRARFYSSDVISISYLKKADGIRARNLIQDLGGKISEEMDSKELKGGVGV